MARRFNEADVDFEAIDGDLAKLAPPKLPAKAPVARPRKALGRIHGLAVRFGDPAPPTLLVGEGIETVLSIVTTLPDTVAAAALSAGRLGAFAPPPGVERLVVARDNDPDGERAAARLARRCARAGVAARVIAPEGADFNDDLLALGSAALAARLAPLRVVVTSVSDSAGHDRQQPRSGRKRSGKPWRGTVSS